MFHQENLVSNLQGVSQISTPFLFFDNKVRHLQRLRSSLLGRLKCSFRILRGKYRNRVNFGYCVSLPEIWYSLNVRKDSNTTHWLWWSIVLLDTPLRELRLFREFSPHWNEGKKSQNESVEKAHVLIGWLAKVSQRECRNIWTVT